MNPTAYRVSSLGRVNEQYLELMQKASDAGQFEIAAAATRKIMEALKYIPSEFGESREEYPTAGW